MFTITIIEHNPKQERRQRELINSRARSHAARVAHVRKRLVSPVPTPAPIQQANEDDRDDGDEATSDDSEGAQPSALALFAGNSDPFDCFDIKITPEFNCVLSFTRDTVLQAHYMPLIMRKLALAVGGDFAQRNIHQGWTEIASCLQDEGSALARLATNAQYLYFFMPGNKNSQFMISYMRRRSLELLREKLERFTDSTSFEEKSNLKLHIFGLFDIECFNGNTTAARVHGKALQRLAQETDGVSLPMALKLLYIICHTAAATGQRTLSDVSEWVSKKLDLYLQKTVPPFPLGVFDSHALNPTITPPQLRIIFNRRWYAVDAMMQASAGKAAKMPGILSDLGTIFMYTALSSLIDMSRLNDLYHDLVENMIMKDASPCERYTAAAISVALNYITRFICGDLTINGVDIRDRSPKLMGQLKLTFTEAYKESTLEDRITLAPAYLWILYVGSLWEHRTALTAKPPLAPDERWFSPLLAMQSSSMDVENWPQMQSVAEEFLYCSLIEPDGQVWFDVLLDKYQRSPPKVVFDLAHRFPWYFNAEK